MLTKKGELEIVTYNLVICALKTEEKEQALNHVWRTSMYR